MIQLTFSKKEFFQHFGISFGSSNETPIETPISSEINSEDVCNTFHYLFDTIQSAIYLCYNNLKWDMIAFHSNDEKTDNGLMKLKSKVHYDIIYDMFEKCNVYTEIFVNYKYFPVLLENGQYEPYYNVHGRKKMKNVLPKYSTICSFAKKTNFNDVLIPSPREWARATQWEEGRQFPNIKTIDRVDIEWNNKISKCVFSDSNKGFNRKWLFRFNTFPKCVGGIYKDPVYLMQLQDEITLHGGQSPLVDRMNFAEQCKYKFILYVDHFTIDSAKLSMLFSSKSCILMVESDWKCWFSHMIRPFEHYIPVTESTFNDTLDWCLKNEEKCKKIAENAYNLYASRLTKKAMISFLQQVLKNNPVHVTHPPIHYDTWLKDKMGSFNYTIPFFTDDELGASIESIPKKYHYECFFQTLVMFQYLKWHYCAYLHDCKIIVKEEKQTFSLHELYDHFFNVEYKVYIYNKGYVSYVTEQHFTNIENNKDNLEQILEFFKKSPVIQYEVIKDVVQDKTWLPAVKSIFKTMYKPSSSYRREHPVPLLPVPSNLNIYQYPIPFDFTTNKLLVYRQSQLFKKYHLKFFQEAFEKIIAEPVKYTIQPIHYIRQCKYNNNYREELPLVKTNDTRYIRLMYELLGFIKVVNYKDYNYYKSIFKQLLNTDKIEYSICYGQIYSHNEFLKETKIKQYG